MMVREFQSHRSSGVSIFAENMGPEVRPRTALFRSSAATQATRAYARSHRAHDPLHPFSVGKTLEEIRRSGATSAVLCESWVWIRRDCIIRSPRVTAPSRCTVVLTWRYDQHELRLRFTGKLLFAGKEQVSRGEAEAMLLAWNDSLIRGEMTRLREAGIPPDSPAWVDSDLTDETEDW